MSKARRRTDISIVARLGMAGVLCSVSSRQSASAQIGAVIGDGWAGDRRQVGSAAQRHGADARLATDVHLPSGDGVTPLPGRHAVILLRTLYSKTLFAFGFPGNAGAKAAPVMLRSSRPCAVPLRQKAYSIR